MNAVFSHTNSLQISLAQLLCILYMSTWLLGPETSMTMTTLTNLKTTSTTFKDNSDPFKIHSNHFRIKLWSTKQRISYYSIWTSVNTIRTTYYNYFISVSFFFNLVYDFNPSFSTLCLYSVFCNSPIRLS